MGAIPLVTLLARQQWLAFISGWPAGTCAALDDQRQPPQPGMAVALLEDLAATGTSLLTCCELVQGLGARVVSLYALVDREQAPASGLPPTGSAIAR